MQGKKMENVYMPTFVCYSAIKWNFSKFLVDKKGMPVQRYAPTTDPEVRNSVPS